jgi:NitT/TauT family transport system substrate-binding protein
VAGLASPVGGMAPLRSRGGGVLPVNPPICHVATDPVVEPAANATPTQLKLTWNANSICTVGVPVAIQKRIFARHGLSVEPINFGGSTDQLLEAIATAAAQTTRSSAGPTCPR